MSYEIDVDLPPQQDIAALPAEALTALAPADNAGGAVRTLAFGSAGLLTYLVLDDVQRVDVLIVAWAG